MRAGRLRHRVRLQEATETCDVHGQPVPTWATKATVWAGVEPLRGKELETANQTIAETAIKVVIRYRHDVVAAWRVLFGSRTFEILSVIDPGTRNRELQLMCREIT